MELKKANIRNNNGLLYVSSRDIAKGIGRRHSHILRDIEKITRGLTNSNLDNEGIKKFGSPKVDSESLRDYFIESTYKNRGKDYKEILTTKKGFTLYMFNIQGYQAFKIAYINEFERMEKLIKAPEGITREEIALIEKAVRRNLTDVIQELGEYGKLSEREVEFKYIHYSNLARKCVGIPDSQTLPKNKMNMNQLRLLESCEQFIINEINLNMRKQVEVSKIYSNVKLKTGNYFNKIIGENRLRLT